MSQAAAPSAASTPGASLIPDSTDIFTAAHFVWIALFALLVVAAIVWGVRQKARRREAAREVRQHNEELEAAPLPPSAPAERPPVEPTAASPAVPAASPPPTGGAADGPVTQLKGLGPKVAARLGELGITTVGQIAALTDDQAADLDRQLGAFAGRMGRDRWLEQARFLAAGDKAGFEAVFGRL